MAYDIAMNIGTNDLILFDRDLMVIDNAERVAQQIVIQLNYLSVLKKGIYRQVDFFPVNMGFVYGR